MGLVDIGRRHGLASAEDGYQEERGVRRFIAKPQSWVRRPNIWSDVETTLELRS